MLSEHDSYVSLIHFYHYRVFVRDDNFIRKQSKVCHKEEGLVFRTLQYPSLRSWVLLDHDLEVSVPLTAIIV